MRPKFIAEAVHTAASDIVPNTVVRCHRVNTIPYHHPKVNRNFEKSEKTSFQDLTHITFVV